MWVCQTTDFSLQKHQLCMDPCSDKKCLLFLTDVCRSPKEETFWSTGAARSVSACWNLPPISAASLRRKVPDMFLVKHVKPADIWGWCEQFFFRWQLTFTDARIGVFLRKTHSCIQIAWNTSVLTLCCEEIQWGLTAPEQFFRCSKKSVTGKSCATEEDKTYSFGHLLTSRPSGDFRFYCLILKERKRFIHAQPTQGHKCSGI